MEFGSVTEGIFYRKIKRNLFCGIERKKKRTGTVLLCRFVTNKIMIPETPFLSAIEIGFLYH